MQFLIDERAAQTQICVQDEALKHLKARRLRPFDRLDFINLSDDFIYTYELKNITKKGFEFELLSIKKGKEKSSKGQMALSVIDVKVLEKLLPFLNELDLARLYLIYADFSQKNFKIDLEKLKRILINSCQQCGRSDLMQIKLFNNVLDFKKAFENVVLLDFEGENLNVFLKEKSLEAVLDDYVFFVGAEGGFSAREKELFKDKIKLAHPLILRSQTAIIALASKLLLN